MSPDSLRKETNMAKRTRIPNGASRRSFTRHAGTHGKNLLGNPMRGGIRL